MRTKHNLLFTNMRARAFSLSVFLRQCLIVTVLAYSTSLPAAEKLFELVQTAQLAATARGAVSAQVFFHSTDSTKLAMGALYDVAMPTGSTMSAKVIMHSGTAPVQGHNEEFVSHSTDAKVLRLGENEGSVELHLVGDAIAGITLNDLAHGKIYRARIDASGTGQLVEINPDSILCFEMPKAPTEKAIAKSLERVPAGLSLTTVQNLQSRPGATNTVFIDNWGGVYTGGAWNSGNPIHYTPFSSDNDTTAFSTADIEHMWLAWAEMAEDYADLDVNITTKASVFDYAPVANRSRVIATTTCEWFNNCRSGGVAYTGVFSQNNDYYKTAWTWNLNPGSMGMTHSHEVGHQVGLGHDGTSSLAYYLGHGSWGPIMGAPFNKPYVQWSKGEYPDANNVEDDLRILESVLGVRPDDAGDANASANALEATNGTNFMITHDGYSPDTDVFAFTLSSPQEVSINVLPTLASGGVARAANAALNVALENSDGVVLASITSSDNAPLQPTTNTFSNMSTLDAGTYYLSVDAVSPDTNWETGFGEYGHGGEYRLVVEIDPEITTAIPGSTLAGSTDTLSWIDHGNNVTDYWVQVGSSPGGKQYHVGSSLGANASSTTITTLPTNGSTVWVRFWWRVSGGAWRYSDYDYTAVGSGVSNPSITSPTPDGVLAGATDTFNWVSNGTDASEYWVYAGSTSGGNQYANSGSLSATTFTYSPTSLPIDGSTVYVTLFWREAGRPWQDVVYIYTAARAAGPVFNTATTAGVLAGETDTVQWFGNGSGATEYWLYLGSAVGKQDYLNSRALGAATSLVVSGLPTDGSTVYARLWFRASANDTWLFIDDTLTASTQIQPAITSPIPGGAVAGTSVTLTWEPGDIAVTQWWIYVGTGVGLKNIHDSGSLGSVLSGSVPMPADGSSVHVRLWYKVNGAWKYSDNVYKSSA